MRFDFLLLYCNLLFLSKKVVIIFKSLNTFNAYYHYNNDERLWHFEMFHLKMKHFKVATSHYVVMELKEEFTIFS